jgi:ATP-dependent protease ClpP protease subunit
MKNKKLSALLVAAALLSVASTATALELTQRQLRIDKDLSMTTAHKVAQKLFKLDSAGHEPIFLIISTRSGFAPAAMVVVDAIDAVESPVYAIVQPEAFGVGAIVASFCDKRFAFRNASVLFSKLEYAPEKKMKDAPPLPQTAADAYVQRIWKATAKRLGLDADELAEKATKGWFLTADEARKVGVVTDIIDKVTWVNLVIETTEIKRTTVNKVKRPQPATEQK